MSDFDGEMDVDDPPSKNAAQFSSDNTNGRGKRIAADLPIEAEDVLPWYYFPLDLIISTPHFQREKQLIVFSKRVEKYRPNTLEDAVPNAPNIDWTNPLFVQRLPHLLLYGPPGTGKTSTILALARRIYGVKNMRQMVLELNASDDRGIDVFVIHPFRYSLSNSESTLGAFKLIILDEADAMTATAQMALRRIMEKYTANTRFCIIANYTHKLSPALLSRCTRFRFSPLKEEDIRVLVDQVVEKERVRIQPEAIDSLVQLSKGDMRRALNVLQACHASTPHPSDIKTIITTLLTTSDVTSCLNTIKTLKSTKGLALADILTSISTELQRIEVPAATRIVWMEGLADIEWRLAAGGGEMVQTDVRQNP
ncbi:activator 1 subunit 3 [Histoplasma mississippiense (nom. inval.)]|uniref:activator 1 subunit 3 n=1 Tax=Ajellomyces capsulatus (strain NAm1 / WU24) TaxID=2059318 RepID=UPI000157C722|nr:activator 1 subunit 3 [Histoplasma mississippiense (nom. inval.)]EDN08403.1 activator 1 subunit 3 [Histoplasma mississippiense (nom. inval.)]